MAKGKHSAALFEVIKGNGAGRSNGNSQSLLTPKWWFKSRQAVSTPAETAPSFNERESSGGVATAAAPPPPAARTTTIPYSHTARSSAVHLDFDRSRKEFTLRLRYTTALVSAFGLCALIASAYVIGRHINRGPQTASAAALPAATLPQYVHQAPQAGVVDASRQRLLHPPVTADSSEPRKPSEPVNATPPRDSVSSLVPPGAETRLPRTIGLNYVIIQTYPNEELQTAQATCDFITKSGIPCTLEKTEFARNWICLVGTAGFSKISSAEFKTYVDNIIRIGEKFPSSHFDHIKPAAYKWKAPVQ